MDKYHGRTCPEAAKADTGSILGAHVFADGIALGKFGVVSFQRNSIVTKLLLRQAWDRGKHVLNHGTRSTGRRILPSGAEQAAEKLQFVRVLCQGTTLVVP